MRKACLAASLVVLVLALAGCGWGSSEPYSDKTLTVIGTAADSGQSTATTIVPKDDPAAVEHIPASAGILVKHAEGTPAISLARALEIARGAGISKGSKSESAVHVLLGSDISRPSDPQATTSAVSAWMVTFHEIALPADVGGGLGSSTVLLSADTGKVIRVVNYAPVQQ